MNISQPKHPHSIAYLMSYYGYGHYDTLGTKTTYSYLRALSVCLWLAAFPSKNLFAHCCLFMELAISDRFFDVHNTFQTCFHIQMTITSDL